MERVGNNEVACVICGKPARVVKTGRTCWPAIPGVAGGARTGDCGDDSSGAIDTTDSVIGRVSEVEIAESVEGDSLGVFMPAAVAGPPSPLNAANPVPAPVVMMPVTAPTPLPTTVVIAEVDDTTGIAPIACAGRTLAAETRTLTPTMTVAWRVMRRVRLG